MRRSLFSAVPGIVLGTFLTATLSGLLWWATRPPPEVPTCTVLEVRYHGDLPEGDGWYAYRDCAGSVVRDRINP